MARVLVVFESKYGQTSKIAEHVGQSARERGHVARVLHVDVARRIDPLAYDTIFVVAPVYIGRHPRKIASFVRSIGDALGKRPSVFVSVSNSAGSSDKERRRLAKTVADAFVAELPWAPEHVFTAGGAFAYPRYGWLTGFIRRRIAESSGGPTDTLHSHELTDWPALDADLATVWDELARGEPRHDDLDVYAPAAE